MLAAAGSPRSIAAAASRSWRARRQVTQGRCPQVLLDAMGIAGRQRDPGQQQAAARGGQMAGQFRGRARIAQREAQQRLLLIGLAEQRRTGSRGQDPACGPDGGQRVAGLSAGRPDPRPVQQRQEFEERSALLGYRQHLLGEVLRGVEVAAFQREAGQRAQMVDGEEMLAESQPPRTGIGGPGRVGGLS